MLLSEASLCFFYSQLSDVSKKTVVLDEDDPVDEDMDVRRTHPGDDVDLFEDEDEPQSSSSTNGSRGGKGDNLDASCGPGKKRLLVMCCLSLNKPFMTTFGRRRFLELDKYFKMCLLCPLK